MNLQRFSTGYSTRVCEGGESKAKTEGEMQAVSDTEANLKSFSKYILSKRKNGSSFKSANRQSLLTDDARAACVCSGLLCSLHSCCQMPIIIHTSNKGQNCYVQ